MKERRHDGWSERRMNGWLNRRPNVASINRLISSKAESYAITVSHPLYHWISFLISLYLILCILEYPSLYHCISSFVSLNILPYITVSHPLYHWISFLISLYLILCIIEYPSLYHCISSFVSLYITVYPSLPCKSVPQTFVLAYVVYILSYCNCIVYSPSQGHMNCLPDVFKMYPSWRLWRASCNNCQFNECLHFSLSIQFQPNNASVSEMCLKSQGSLTTQQLFT